MEELHSRNQDQDQYVILSVILCLPIKYRVQSMETTVGENGERQATIRSQHKLPMGMGL